MKYFYAFSIAAMIYAAASAPSFAADDFTGGFNNSPSYSAFGDPVSEGKETSVTDLAADTDSDINMDDAAAAMGAVEPAAGDETITAKPANDNDAENGAVDPIKMNAEDTLDNVIIQNIHQE